MNTIEFSAGYSSTSKQRKPARASDEGDVSLQVHSTDSEPSALSSSSSASSTPNQSPTKHNKHKHEGLSSRAANLLQNYKFIIVIILLIFIFFISYFYFSDLLDKEFSHYNTAEIRKHQHKEAPNTHSSSTNTNSNSNNINNIHKKVESSITLEQTEIERILQYVIFLFNYLSIYLRINDHAVLLLIVPLHSTR